jgi:hypothetical protein
MNVFSPSSGFKSIVAKKLSILFLDFKKVDPSRATGGNTDQFGQMWTVVRYPYTILHSTKKKTII